MERGRCDYCASRYSWDCDDGWNRVSPSNICEDFKLDWDTLSDKQKKIIQNKLMEKNHAWGWDY